MTKAVPFKIEIAESELLAMRERIKATRWADDFNNADWDYGVEKGWLQGMAEYWAGQFDWRAQEASMNVLPHFRTNIDGIPLHFIHVRGKGRNPLPVILTHGWPWTFWDWNHVIGPLADPASFGGDPDDSFDVIVPSLPGFGFSCPLITPGVDIWRIADLWVRLMRDVLGYNQFAAAGGDWGAFITGEIGHRYPEHLIGVHMTLPVVPGLDFATISRESFAPDEQWMADRLESAYPSIVSHLAVHSSDPQTLAYAMVDSPIGTAAWLWERRKTWSDCDGDMGKVFDRDFLCTTASIYWLTKTIGSSLRLYRERFRKAFPLANDRKPVIPVPTGYAIAPKELLMLPRKVVEQKTNLVRWTLFPRGGHFAPMEVPDLLIHEYREFFRSLR